MAKIIYETREFKDRNTGIVTQYDYIAIAGNDEKSHKYEVSLKNLVQSEKMALLMIADAEGSTGEVIAKKANNGDSPSINRKSEDTINLDEVETDKGMFD